jgi:HAD superfamily phosphatase (TIGR01668 family)
VFHNFVPAHAANSLHEVSLAELKSAGKSLILLDVDHTLVKWKQEDFAEPILNWLAEARQMGFDLCIISNTRRVERLKRLSQKLGIETVRGRFKPSRAMFRLALIKFKKKPEEAVMVGDQLMTDILGANRAGIEAIWVRKMEGKEFGPTKINRFMERLLQSAIYKGLVTPVDEPAAAPSIEQAKPLADRALVHQLVKFGIVGGSGFIIDFGLRWYLTFHAPWGNRLMSDVFGSWLQRTWPFFAKTFSTPANAALPFFIVISSGLAICNNFVWNRLWTFEIKSKEERAAQFRRFVLISVIGLILNNLISTSLNQIIAGHAQKSLALATVIATIVVAVWNFLGYRFYAFKPRTQ